MQKSVIKPVQINPLDKQNDHITNQYNNHSLISVTTDKDDPTNYHQKYLKYKAKYLRLSNSQLGGVKNDSIKVSGPTITGYFTNDKLNKKIIVMGDKHGNKDNDCGPGFPSITEYIDNLIKRSEPLGKNNQNKNYNLFVETVVPRKLERQIGTLAKSEVGINDHLGDLSRYAYQNFKKMANLNIHFTDIRNDMNKPMIICSNNTYRTTYDSLVNLISSFKVANSGIDLREIFQDFFISYLNFIMASISIIKDLTIDDNFLSFSSDTLLKELQKLKEKDARLYQIVSDNALSYINDFMNSVFTEGKDSEIHDIDRFFQLYAKGMFAGAIIQDIYVMARILKSDTYVNNIVYVGFAHYPMIKKILLEMDFGLEEVEEARGNFRCIGLIPFDKFFI